MDLVFDLKNALNDDIIFIDVRSRGYYLISHIEYAINIENTKRIGFIAEENKNKLIVLYCHSGSSAMEMAKELAEQGYKNIQAIQENFFHLHKYGLKIVGAGTEVH